MAFLNRLHNIQYDILIPFVTSDPNYMPTQFYIWTYMCLIKWNSRHSMTIFLFVGKARNKTKISSAYGKLFSSMYIIELHYVDDMWWTWLSVGGNMLAVVMLLMIPCCWNDSCQEIRHYFFLYFVFHDNLSWVRLCKKRALLSKAIVYFCDFFTVCEDDWSVYMLSVQRGRSSPIALWTRTT